METLKHRKKGIEENTWWHIILMELRNCYPKQSKTNKQKINETLIQIPGTFFTEIENNLKMYIET